MLFNSLSFAIFLPIVFILYWFVINKNLKFQNILLLVASYFFYACWDWRFLFLLMFSTFLDYFTGLKMQETAGNQKKKRFWFWLSVTVNLGFLGVFKYYDFFVESFTGAIAHFGFKINPWTIKVILPVGISFYTFHGLSYVIDIYKSRIKAEKNFVDYAVFVSFFPLLVAGPIERATHLLPQVKKPRTFDYEKAVDGMRQILWGLFKKMVIADNCATVVNNIFTDYHTLSGGALLIGAVFFAFQIYGDFSGYSDIAIGTAKLFGIDLLRNFAFPYFSRDIAEFWRRWHISLTTWFRDYLYIPLGGSRGTKWQIVRNTFIIFLVSGFWHGANWTFIAWGAYHAVLFLPLILRKKNRKYTNTVAEGKRLPSIKAFFQMLLTFVLVVIGWVFFRAPSIGDAFGYLRGMVRMSSFFPILPQKIRVEMSTVTMPICIIMIPCMLFVEWAQRNKQHGLDLSGIKSQVLRFAIYYALILALFTCAGEVETFIYFQF
jgi:D-alanyl-lipoteichoic acid acyltransferase DltB (MBOAT superfamily)